MRVSIEIKIGDLRIMYDTFDVRYWRPHFEKYTTGGFCWSWFKWRIWK